MEVNVEEIVKLQVAKKIIESLPEEERRKVLEASLAKTLHEVLRPWNVEQAIRDDVNKYMVNYLKRPEIQEQIKSVTEKAVDKLMQGLMDSIIYESQDHIKSNYTKFIEKPKKVD